jgi:isocitrate/isopropylmalate dehydrogenase
MGKTHTVTLIPGDGIGPEVTDAVVRILEATGAATCSSRGSGLRRARARLRSMASTFRRSWLRRSSGTGGAEGAGDDAGGRRVSVDQRDAAEEV